VNETRNLRRPDWAALCIAAALAGLAALIAWDTSRLGGAGSYARIGPQTVPYLVALGLAGLGAWTVLAAFRGDFPAREPQEARPVLWIVGGLVAQMVLLRPAGFTIATALLFAATARGMGRVNPAVALGAGVLLSGFVWFVFARLLQLSLPAGPVENAIAQGGDWLVGQALLLWTNFTGLFG
jgi:putative tricarboxylic transport membrane protein